MVTLTFGSRTLTLRNPNFGNTESLEQRRIYRKTRGGDLKVYRDSSWPVTATFEYDFSYLKEVDLYAIIDFVRASLGQLVTMVDYEGRTWTGIIITPAEEIKQAARQDTQFKIQFQEASA